MSLSAKQKQRIVLRHKHSISRHGYTPSALFWSSQDIQKIRFKQFSNFLSLFFDKTVTVLDVGCGFGDLKFFLEDENHNIQYAGIDISPDMVFSGNSQSPDLNLKEGEVFDFEFSEGQFDFVFLSGALNEVVDLDGKYALSVIRKMYEISKLGVAFNLLNVDDKWVGSRTDLQSFKKEEIVSFCRQFCLDIDLVDDYLDNDFTIFLKKY